MASTTPFLTVEWPPLSFWHRFVRAALGLIILIASIAYLPATFFYFFMVGWFASSVKYSPVISGSEAILAHIGIVIFIIGSLAWVVAALVLIFRPLYQRSALATYCALASIVSFSAFRLIVLAPSLPLWAVLVPAIAALHLSLAIGTIRFSRRTGPPFQYQFRDNSTAGAPENATATAEEAHQQDIAARSSQERE